MLCGTGPLLDLVSLFLAGHIICARWTEAQQLVTLEHQGEEGEAPMVATQGLPQVYFI